MLSRLLVAAFTTLCLAQNITAQQDPGLLADPGTAGPQAELVHLYYDEWPTGIAVSRSGRLFSNYPPALDPNNTAYTVAELFPNNTERAYPSLDYNSPPGGRIDYNSSPEVATGNAEYLIGVQSVVIDGADRLWILDTGRVAVQNGTMLSASPGGAKLVGVDLQTDQIFKTIIFDATAAPPDSYLNDVRFDLNPATTASGQGVAYITDSSPEGRNAIVVVDLGTGEAWRRLILDPSVQATSGFVPTVWGEPIFINDTSGAPASNLNFGADGIALSADGSRLFYSTTGNRLLSSIPTSALLSRSSNADLLAKSQVMHHGETGLKDGLESDSNNLIYAGNIEDNSLSVFDPTTGSFQTLIRDPRFSWTDTLAVGFDGYLYWTENQLWRRPAHWKGQERRQRPWALFRIKLDGGGTKVVQNAPGGGNGTSSA